MNKLLMASAFVGASLLFGVGEGSAAESHKYSSDVKIEATTPDGKGGFTCSGVYIGDGIVITARHCVNKKVFVKVILDADGEEGLGLPAVVEWVSKTDDIAAYRVPQLLLNTNIASSELSCRTPKIGEPIEIVGNPLGETFIHTWGRVAGNKRSVNVGVQVVGDEFPIDAEIASGNSGGPVYDASGRVLGVASFGSSADKTEIGHVYFAVSSEGACDKYGPHVASK